MFPKRRGEITAVRDLFAKYKKTLQAPQKTVELEAIKVIGELTKLKLNEGQLKYTPSTRILSITASSMIKQEIKLKQENVLETLKQNLGPKNSPKSIV